MFVVLLMLLGLLKVVFVEVRKVFLLLLLMCSMVGLKFRLNWKV